MQIVKTAIKGKIIDFKKKTFGLFVVSIEEENEKTINVNAICGKSNFISTYDISTMYVVQTIDLMETLLIRGEGNLVDSIKLQNALKKNEELFFQLAQHTGAQQNFENTLVARLNILFDCDFKIDIDFDNLDDTFEYSDMIAKALSKMEDQQNEMFRKDFNIPFGVEILQCNTILSPIAGVAVRSLKKGDVIVCYPSEEWAYSKNLAVNNGFYDEELGEMKKIQGVITQIKSDNKLVSFLLKINDTLAGVTSADEGVKIESPDEDKSYESLRMIDEMSDDEGEGGQLNTPLKIFNYIKSLLIDTPLGYYLSLALAIIVLLVIIYRLL